MCKLLKVYPVVVSFETTKKVVLKTPEYWVSSKESSEGGSSFVFADFIRAFKILSRIGYKDVNETDESKFNMMSQYLRKSMQAYKAMKFGATEVPNKSQNHIRAVASTT